jgi:hypothetical protein
MGKGLRSFDIFLNLGPRAFKFQCTQCEPYTRSKRPIRRYQDQASAS